MLLMDKEEFINIAHNIVKEYNKENEKNKVKDEKKQ